MIEEIKSYLIPMAKFFGILGADIYTHAADEIGFRGNEALLAEGDEEWEIGFHVTIPAFDPYQPHEHEFIVTDRITNDEHAPIRIARALIYAYVENEIDTIIHKVEMERTISEDSVEMEFNYDL